jgi:hypothetical protein
MKLIFFLVAFCLISLRVYFSWSGKDRESRGISESNMVVKSDNFLEKIKYSGKFELTDDETAFKSISPGGYFKYEMNDETVKAESNLKGEIEYTLYDGKNNLVMDDKGKALVAKAIREMIAWGYDAQGRMERIYKKEGVKGLLAEVDSVRVSQTKIVYLNRLFSLIDSLSPEDQVLVVDKVKSLNSDMDERQLLEKVPLTQLKNPNISAAYFDVAGGINSDIDKASILNHYLDLDTITTENTFKLLRVSATLNSDMDKANVYKKAIEKGIINGPGYDSLLNLVSDINSDMDKANLYKELIALGNISEAQWIDLVDKISSINSDLDKANLYKELIGMGNISEALWVDLIGKVSSMNSDMDKANLLVEIAPKMPKTDIVKTNYQKAAKTLNSDMDYGKVMRALE